MSDEKDLRKWMLNEYKKCALDPVYFIKKYVKIQTQDSGIVPFDLFDFQEKMLENINNNDRIIILKSRQMGISTLIAAYTLWMMLFNDGKNILVVSIKETTAKEIVSKIKLANEKLPSFLKIQAIEYNKHSIKLENNSMVLAVSSASDSARSFSASFIIFDEAAFIPEIEDLWTSAQPTLSTVNKGKAIILSTPCGVGGFFHTTWVNAEKKKNGFFTIILPWNLRPDRDKKWKEKQVKELGIRLFGQEYDCDFLSSGTNVIDLATLKEYEENSIKIDGDVRPQMGVRDPIEFRYSNNLWIWELPKDGNSYIVCADPARGDGTDYSAAHVLNLETLEQVAEFQQQITPKEFADILVNLATEYKDALLIVEYNGLGPAVLQQIIDRNYKNTFYSSLDLKVIEVQRQIITRYYAEEKKLKPGFTTTISSRPLLISKLQAYFRERMVDIHSIRTITELKTFIWENGKAQAAQNYNDDLTMALCLGLWVRDTALRLRQDGIIFSKTMLDKISIQRGDQNVPLYTARTANAGQSQWQMKVGNKPDQIESLTWLLK